MARRWHSKPAMPRLRPLGSHWSTTGLHMYCLAHEGAGPIMHDLSGNERHGVLTDMDPATDWETAVGSRLGGSVLDFDDTNAKWVRFPDMMNNLTAFTVIVDLYLAVKTHYFIIASSNQMYISSYNGRFDVQNGDGSSYEDTCRVDNASKAGWHQWTATWVAGPDNMYTYMDGVPVGSNEACALVDTGTNSTDLTLMAWSPATSIKGPAKVGRVVIYERDFSAAEVLSFYNYPFISLQPRSRGLWRLGAAAAGLELEGTMVAELTAAGTLSKARALAGSLISELTGAGSLTRQRQLAASLVAELAATGTLSRARALAAEALMALVAEGDLSRARALAGMVMAELTGAGTLTRGRSLSGDVMAELVAAGELTRRRQLIGEMLAEMIMSGALSRGRSLSGDVMAELVARLGIPPVPPLRAIDVEVAELGAIDPWTGPLRAKDVWVRTTR